MKSKSVLVGAAVAALAVGYVVGASRDRSPAGQAMAGPWFDPVNSVLITASTEGGSVTVWKMAKGEPVEARSYYTRTQEGKDAKGQPVETRQLAYVAYPGPAREWGK